MPLTPKFLLLHPITTLKLSAPPFLPPQKLCGWRWALRKILMVPNPTQNMHHLPAWPTHARPMPSPDTIPGEAPQMLSCLWLAVAWARCPTLPSHHNSLLQKLIKNSGCDTCSNWDRAGNSCCREDFNPVGPASGLCKCVFPYKTKWEICQRRSCWGLGVEDDITPHALQESLTATPPPATPTLPEKASQGSPRERRGLTQEKPQQNHHL